MNEPETQAEAVVCDALEHSPDEREVFVSETCGANESLHQQVRRLLEAHRADANAAREQIPLTPTVEADLIRLKPEEPGIPLGPTNCANNSGRAASVLCGLRIKSSPFIGGWR
jgi:hypothetical protein